MWLACVLLFLAGVGQGGAAPVVTALVAEAAPTTSRGRMVGVTEVMFAGGWAVAALLARTLADASSWRLLIGLGGVALLLVPLGMWSLTDSRPPEATPEAASNPGTLWQAGLRSRTLVMWLLWLAIFCAWFGPVIWLPTLLARMSDANPVAKGSLVAVAMLAGASLVLLVIDRLGRRTMVIPGLAMMAAACAGMAAASNGTLLVVACVALGFAGQIIWPVCLTYSAEIYPTGVRGLGVGWALGAGRLGAMLAPLALGALLTTFGQAAALLPFGVLCAVAAVVVFALGPETAGHDLHAPLRELAGVG
jgi:MFS family permease